MCLAIPAKVVALKDSLATVEINGIQREVSTMLLSEIKLDDYVLVHAGFAMQIVSQEDAEITNGLLEEMKGHGRTVR